MRAITRSQKSWQVRPSPKHPKSVQYILLQIYNSNPFACDPKVQTSLNDQQSGILNEETKARIPIQCAPVKWTNINAEEPPRKRKAFGVRMLQ
jgi:hypothetical protein